jgi:hypothetical protein
MSSKAPLALKKQGQIFDLMKMLVLMSKVVTLAIDIVKRF